mmetsp:Transcript_148302/g.385537  ORF Transcript_148302/g.385537 Transcript_148302/m.385537 type:complete len:350 (+) Transcript_148302:183-1232(+)
MSSCRSTCLGSSELQLVEPLHTWISIRPLLDESCRVWHIAATSVRSCNRKWREYLMLSLPRIRQMPRAVLLLRCCAGGQLGLSGSRSLFTCRSSMSLQAARHPRCPRRTSQTCYEQPHWRRYFRQQRWCFHLRSRHWAAYQRLQGLQTQPAEPKCDRNCCWCCCCCHRCQHHKHPVPLPPQPLSPTASAAAPSATTAGLRSRGSAASSAAAGLRPRPRPRPSPGPGSRAGRRLGQPRWKQCLQGPKGGRRSRPPLPGRQPPGRAAKTGAATEGSPRPKAKFHWHARTARGRRPPSRRCTECFWGEALATEVRIDWCCTHETLAMQTPETSFLLLHRGTQDPREPHPPPS